MSGVQIAYNIIDKACRDIGNHKETHDALNKFISIFLNKSASKKIFFTLNQDLFIERRLQILIDRCHQSSYEISLSQNGINNNPVWIERLGFDISNIKADSEPFNHDWCVYLRNVSNYQERINQWCSGKVIDICQYVKLHGSFDLYKSENEPLMILGKTKEILIADSDLLKFYFDTFTKVLKENQCEILVIGYSFSDEHINKILQESIDAKDSKIHIVTKESISNFRENKVFPFIQKNLCGFYSDGLTARNIDLILKNGFVD